MAEKKISDLTGKDNIGDNDELVFVDKATTSGTDAGVGGQTSKIKFSDLKNAVGTSGPQGSQGATGAQGGIGGTGGPGPQGSQGSQGVRGLQGAKGNNSTVAGPQGKQGAKGNNSTVAGPQGPQGRQGAKGNNSTVAGPQGKQGSQGSKGDPASIRTWKSNPSAGGIKRVNGPTNSVDIDLTASPFNLPTTATKVILVVNSGEATVSYWGDHNSWINIHNGVNNGGRTSIVTVDLKERGWVATAHGAGWPEIIGQHKLRLFITNAPGDDNTCQIDIQALKYLG